jgi:hypothetical protein
MKTLILGTLLASLSVVSCSNSPNARTGTVIGSQSGRGLEGAAIGAGLGALGGNLIGGSRDQRNDRYYDQRDNRRRY